MDARMKRLVEKAKPFARVLQMLKSYEIVVDDFGLALEDLVGVLRADSLNCLCICGLSPDGDAEARGLLCIDEDSQFADVENCFFIGQVKLTGHSEEFVLMMARQLDEYLDGGTYMICAPSKEGIGVFSSIAASLK